MTVVVFDDIRSLVHFIVGVIACFFPILGLIFIAYEVAEYLYKRRKGKETYNQFIGDIIEFYVGYFFPKALLDF